MASKTEKKTARLTLLLDPRKKALFEEICAAQDLTPSQVVRQLIRDYLALHGVTYVPSGGGSAAYAAAPAAKPAKERAAPKRARGAKGAKPRARRAPRSKA